MSLTEISAKYTPDIYQLAANLGLDINDEVLVERIRKLWGEACKSMVVITKFLKASPKFWMNFHKTFLCTSGQEETGKA